jgi:hypothetical protein
MEKEKLAFEQKDRDFKIKVFYLKEPNNGDALVELYYGRKKVRKLLYPAYKIWNLSAHFSDIVDGELSQDDKSRGYRIAGSDGLGGGVMPINV